MTTKEAKAKATATTEAIAKQISFGPESRKD
jgi:hypothetical protein